MTVQVRSGNVKVKAPWGTVPVTLQINVTGKVGSGNLGRAGTGARSVGLADPQADAVPARRQRCSAGQAATFSRAVFSIFA